MRERCSLVFRIRIHTESDWSDGEILCFSTGNGSGCCCCCCSGICCSIAMLMIFVGATVSSSSPNPPNPPTLPSRSLHASFFCRQRKQGRELDGSWRGGVVWFWCSRWAQMHICWPTCRTLRAQFGTQGTLFAWSLSSFWKSFAGQLVFCAPTGKLFTSFSGSTVEKRILIGQRGVEQHVGELEVITRGTFDVQPSSLLKTRWFPIPSLAHHWISVTRVTVCWRV